MVSNIGKITNLAATPSTGLVDGSDKLHSGILKVLESFSQGDMCISHAGFTITDGGTYTQYNLAQPIKFLKRGEFVNHTVTLTEAYTSSPVQNASHTRYDWVLINPATPELVIVQGTAASTPTVADITAGYIPIALVQVTAGDNTTDDKSDYSFQTFTLDVTKKSLSIIHGGNEAGNITGDTDSIDIASTITNADINLTPNGTGDIKLGTLKIDGDQTVGSGQDGYVLTYTHSNGKAALAEAASGLDIDSYSALGGTGLHQTQDHFVFSDNGTEKKISFTNLEDAIFADVSGDATIAAGGALTIGANAVEGSMLNSNTAGSGLDYGSNQLSVDVSDFMTNGLNNRIVTATGTDGMNAEANAQFDGSTLTVTGSISATVSTTTSGLEFIGSEVLQDGVLPVPSYAKSIVFINDISAGPGGGGAPTPNQIVLPDASTVAKVRLTFRNINGGTAGSQNAVTIIPDSTTPDVIDFGQTDHAYVTSANVITLAVGQSITLHAITDAGGAPIQTGWYVIGI